MFKKLSYIFFAVVMAFSFFASSCFGSSTASSASQKPLTYELKFNQGAYELKDGQKKVLDLTFTVNGNSAPFSSLVFLSSNNEVVTVEQNGIITGVAEGNATVIVSFKEMRAEAQVSVIMRPRSVQINADDCVMFKNDRLQLSANYLIDGFEASTKGFTWESSNPSVVSVNNGLLTAQTNGMAKITVSCVETNQTDTITVTVVSKTTASIVNAFKEQAINIYGRSYIQNGRLCLDHVANAVELAIVGQELSVELTADYQSVMKVYIDDDTDGKRLEIKKGTAFYTVAQNLEDEYHKIRIVKGTEMQDATWQIHAFTATQFATVLEKVDLKIEFIGDSITAGYGVLGEVTDNKTVENSDCTSAYAYLAVQELGADYSIVAWSGICAKAYHWCPNLNMFDLYQRVSYKRTTQYVETDEPDIIVVNLGGNESSYLDEAYGGAAYGEQFPADYKEFLQLVRQKSPNAYIVCLYGMMGTNDVIETGIQTAIAEINDNKIVYNPFAFLPNMEAANGHPNLSAQKEWATLLVTHIRSLEWEDA